MIKKELHLEADNEQEAANGRLSCFVDISRSSVELLKVTEKFKAVEFISWQFPYSETDAVWCNRVSDILEDVPFKTAAGNSNCNFSIHDEKFVLIPEVLFSETDMQQQLNFLFPSANDAFTETQKMSNTDIVGIFSIPGTLGTALNGSVTSSFLNWINSNLGNTAGIKAVLVLGEKRFSLTITREGKLLFTNWFGYSQPDDVLYFLMASLEALNILHSDVTFNLGGRVDKNDDTFNMLTRFIPKVSFLKRPKNLTYSYSLSQLPEHRFPFIFAAACA